MRTLPTAVALAAVVGLGWFPSAPTAEAAVETGVTWYLDPDPVPVGALELSCGSYGRFELKRGFSADVASPKCGDTKAKECGSELARAYPSPLFPGAKARGAKATPAEAWIPCDQGACFTALDKIESGEPWVAVIDWDNQHGWSVGWTIAQLSRPAGGREAPVVLFDLYENFAPALAPFSQLGATDVHVLKQLCKLAEAVDHKNIPPSVINLSFGRIWQAEDALDPGTCDRSRLSCQIARVLHHLACGTDGDCPQEPRTIPVAAAGNQPPDRLFPAVLGEVVAAGSLQLGRFGLDGAIGGSWETPDYGNKAHAFFPGYGLCLADKDAGDEWPAPPGTSYAAAIFSGWLTEAKGRVPIADPFSAAPWFPRSAAGSRGPVYTLIHGEHSYGGNARAQSLFDRSLSPASHACERLPAAGEGVERTAVLADSEDLDRLKEFPSFLEILDQLTERRNGPAPPERPCVTCIRSDTASPPLRGAAKASAAGLSIDMAASANGGGRYFDRFPDLEAIPGIERGPLFLRVREKLFRLGVDGFDTIPADTGHLDIPEGVDLQPGEQPSLIYFYRWNELEFWTAVPILLR